MPSKLMVVIPCYNEEEVLPETSKRLVAKMAALQEKGLITADSRVLLVDCDLRNPSVAKALRMNTKHSVVDFLSGKMMLRELLYATEVENLFLIPGGPGGSMISDLITRERGVSMIQAARKLFDFVILDTPPCAMLADAAEVATLADAGLLVVRQDYASRDQIIDGVQRLGEADLPMIGWVFNFVERSLSDGEGYGYGDIYGYGKKGK